jgi:hypothetical protein
LRLELVIGIFGGLAICRPGDRWGGVDLFVGVIDLPAGVFDLSEGVDDRPAGLHGRGSAFEVFVVGAVVLDFDGEVERVDGGLADSEGVLNRFVLNGNRDCGDCFMSGGGDLYLSRFS